MITNLYIKNFKILKDIDLTLSNLNLISGKNSVGKSSLIQVLLLIRQSFEKMTLIDKGLLLQGEYIKLGKGRDIFSKNSEDDYLQFIIDWDDITDLNLKYIYTQNSDLQPIEKENTLCTDYNKLSKHSLFNDKFTYLAAERISPKDSYPISDYHVSSLKSLGIKGEYTPHFLSVFANNEISNESLLHKSTTNKTLIAQVCAWMSEIADGIKINTKIIEDINGVSLTYQFLLDKEYSDNFSPQNVGFGLTYVLPVITALLSAEKGDLLLIENPEAHLHPAGQAAVGKLISLAANNGVQIIIETHSDHILNGIRSSVALDLISPEDITLYYFNKSSTGNNIDIINPELDNHGKLNQWPKGFFDEWNKQLDILLGL